MNPPEQSATITPDDFATVVDCSANPMDVRPAVNAVMETLFEKIKECQKTGKKIVILCGETHTMSTHIGLQQVLLSEMFNNRASGKIPRFAVGFELEHNLLESDLEHIGIDIPDHLRGRLARLDRNGKETLRANTQLRYIGSAPSSNESLMLFCQKNRISSRFNDLANNINGYLDPSDPFTNAIIDRFAPEGEDKDGIKDMSPLEMALRNHAIVAQAMDHMRQSSAQIYVQTTGMSHIYGNNNPYFGMYEYEHSLGSLFQQAGAEVIAILPTYGSFLEQLPIEAREAANKTGILIKGLSEKEFFYSPQYRDLAPERAFLADIFAHSGGITQVLELDNKGQYRPSPEFLAHIYATKYPPALPALPDLPRIGQY